MALFFTGDFEAEGALFQNRVSLRMPFENLGFAYPSWGSNSRHQGTAYRSSGRQRGGGGGRRSQPTAPGGSGPGGTAYRSRRQRTRRYSLPFQAAADPAVQPTVPGGQRTRRYSLPFQAAEDPAVQPTAPDGRGPGGTAYRSRRQRRWWPVAACRPFTADTSVARRRMAARRRQWRCAVTIAARASTASGLSDGPPSIGQGRRTKRYRRRRAAPKRNGLGSLDSDKSTMGRKGSS